MSGAGGRNKENSRGRGRHRRIRAQSCARVSRASRRRIGWNLRPKMRLVPRPLPRNLIRKFYRVSPFLMGKVDAASVAVPTVAHAEVGCQLLEMGIDVLVEKPMAVNLAEADLLLAAAKKHQRILQVGHVERFNPAVIAVEPVLNRPLFFEVHRLGVFTPRSLDVDVIYDLMIHDLDILLALVKEPVTEVKAVGIPVLTDKVDIAHARLEFVGGAVANVTASRVSTERVRKMRFFQQHEYISLDYARRDAYVLE